MHFAGAEAELWALKAIAENVIAYFYPKDPDSVARALDLLDMLLTWSWEVIISNMRKASSLTLEILKSLYPRPTWMPWVKNLQPPASRKKSTTLFWVL
jgi:hypothetical protein